MSQLLPAFDKIETENDEDGIVYKAYQNNQWVGTAVECTGNGFSGDIVVMVGFDNQHQLIDYVVLKQTETPGLGTKMVTWFKEKASLKGRKMDLNNPLKVSKEASKDSGDVQAITAATISSRAFIDVVNNAYRIAMGHNATTADTEVK